MMLSVRPLATGMEGPALRSCPGGQQCETYAACWAARYSDPKKAAWVYRQALNECVHHGYCSGDCAIFGLGAGVGSLYEAMADLVNRDGMGIVDPTTCTPGTEGCSPATRPYTGPSMNPTYLPEGTIPGSQYGPSSGRPGTGTAALDPAVRAALAAQGINIDCREVCDGACLAAGMSPCCSTLCDVGDGSGYSRSAQAINYNPGVLLVELGAKLPLFGGSAPSGQPRAQSTPVSSTTRPQTTAHPSAAAHPPTAPVAVAATSDFPAVIDTLFSSNSPMLWLAVGIGAVLILKK